ncbi:DUF998 domain-containing protein [Terrabacter aerolatus]|nr:DUF998 domain-containing protein [Terrabacter aerolatus]
MTLGRGCWLAQPGYLLVELLVAAGASTTYSLRDDTISALGMLTCGPGHGGSPVDICSPWHVGMDAAFIVFGVLRAAGAVLLRPRFGAGAWGGAAVALWVVSAIAAAAVGLVPVDQQPSWHVVAALPVFVLQPLAVLVTAEALRRSGAVSRTVARSGLVVGVLTLLAAAAFALRLGAVSWVGGLERLALWPAYPWLGVVALALVPASRSETVTKP